MCICCEQQFYKHQVQVATDKFQSTYSDLKCFTGNPSVDGMSWLCHRCLTTIRKNRVPAMAIVNGYQYMKMPPRNDATREEELLCCPRIPFMRLIALPKGFQRASVGAVVNVPSKTEETMKVLPRTATDANLTAVELKRQHSDAKPYFSRYVRTNLVHEFSQWLCEQEFFQKNSIKYNPNILVTGIQHEDTQHESYTQHESDGKEPPDPTEEDEPIEGNVDTLLNEPLLSESSEKIVISPTSGESPKSIFADEFAEELAYVTLFDGRGRKPNSVRVTNVNYRHDCFAELRSINRKFARHRDNIFFKVKKSVIRRVYTKVHITTKRRKGKICAGDVKSGSLQNMFKDDKLFAFLANERLSPPYFEQMGKEFRAMIRQTGLPTYFITFSMHEAGWLDLLRILFRSA